MLILRKYPNRRLYNPEESTYITQKDVVAYVQQGRVFRVFAYPSKEDITRVTLLQILAMADAEAETPQLTEEILRGFLERAPARSGSTASSARQEVGVREPESRQP